MYGIDLSRPGAQAYYDDIVAMYAGRGVDFIKGDDFIWPIAIQIRVTVPPGRGSGLGETVT